MRCIIRRKLKKAFYISLVLIVTSSCFFEEPNFSKPLVKDLKLEWWGEPKNQTVTMGMVRGDFGGLLIIPETVFAVGYSNEFLIAKSYPNKEREIENRLFNYDEITGDYFLTEPNDTIYLSSDDKYYEKDGKWYHISNGWNPPKGLFPYKDSIYYHIIDMRNWDSSKKWDDQNLYQFRSKSEFDLKRNELNIPESIDFEVVYKESE